MESARIAKSAIIAAKPALGLAKVDAPLVILIPKIIESIFQSPLEEPVIAKRDTMMMILI